MKKLLDNTFWRQGYLLGNIYLTKSPELRRKTDFPLILLTIHLTNLKNILSNINLLLTSDEEHRQIFFEVSIMDFKRVKSLKDLLVRTKVSVEKETDGKSCENLVVRGNAAKIARFRTNNLFH